MYRNDYDKALERIRTAVEFAKDYGNIRRCEYNLSSFDRDQALTCLQDMIKEYENQINTFGIWVDGVRVVRDVPTEQFTDMHIQAQLRYVNRHIPVYVLLREGKKELAKQIANWLNGQENKCISG